ncbi:hypothetical protein AHAS_Ahas20G0198900 [Arachis hypogaea]
MVKQNFMGYYPPSQTSNGGWEYHQEITDSKHSNPWRYASEPQDEQESHMGYFSPPQNDSSHYSNGGWKYYQEIANSEQSINMRDCPTSPPTSTFENSSSPKYASTKTSTSQRLSKLESMFNRIVEEQQQSWREREILFQQTDELLENIGKCSEPLSKENEDQLMDVKEKVEEQESKEDTQEKSHSTKTEKCKEEGLMEQPIQKVLDEYKTPIITQQPSLESKGVKATSKSTNPVPDSASKINQAICKRKLAEERPRQGTVAESSPLLRSFLLTN